MLLQAGVVGAQNLATNPGFELGNTSGWYGFGSPTIYAETSQVHSGNYACLVTNRTATYMGIAQTFTGVLATNQTYNISAWVELVSGTNQTMQLTIQQVDGSGTGYSLIVSGSVSTNGWTQLSGQFTFNQSGSLTSLVLYAEVPSSTNAAYYIDDVSVLAPAAASTNGQCLVDWTNVFQRIDGFGASSAWDGSWTAAQADMFFSTNTGLGLSLLRNHITYASSTAATAIPTTVETSIMQMAQARGARIWSTPWTPPVGFKNTNDLYDSLPITNAVYGGSYLGSGNNATNLAYASQLANYVSSMQNTYGVNIYAISIQNEPDASVNTYEACQWTGQQIHDFSTNLYSALAAKGVGSTKIMLPESENWASNSGLWTPTLADSNAAAAVSIIANHNYVANNAIGDQATPAVINTSGKALWETEVALLSGSDSSITNAVYWAGRIHLFMTTAQANAWHYWWLVDTGNGGLADSSGNTTKRMYALGQFSRFVRPNYYRIGVDTNSGPLQISAYKDPIAGGFAIVAINSGTADVSQVFNLSGFSATTVTPWVTSATLSLASQAAVAVNGTAFTSTIPALSIVTFVGQNTASPVPLATTLSLGSSGSPSIYGNPVTFTAGLKTNEVTVGSVSGETISFYDGATLLGTAALNGGGQAAFTTSNSQLNAGTHAIIAGYAGDAAFLGSTNSPALSQNVTTATLTVTNVFVLNKVFDGTTNATLNAANAGLSGSQNGDSVTLLTAGATAWFADANVGSNKPVTVAGLTFSSPAAGNYSLTQPTGLTANILQLAAPVFSAPAITAMDGGWQLNFDGQAGQAFHVLATADLTLPLNQWTVITNGIFGSVPVVITDTNANVASRFYRVVSP